MQGGGRCRALTGAESGYGSRADGVAVNAVPSLTPIVAEIKDRLDVQTLRIRIH